MYFETVGGQRMIESISYNLLRIADAIEEELKIAQKPMRKQHLVATNEESFLTCVNHLLDNDCLYIDRFRDNNSNLIYILYEERTYKQDGKTR